MNKSLQEVEKRAVNEKKKALCEKLNIKKKELDKIWEVSKLMNETEINKNDAKNVKMFTSDLEKIDKSFSKSHSKIHKAVERSATQFKKELKSHSKIHKAVERSATQFKKELEKMKGKYMMGEKSNGSDSSMAGQKLNNSSLKLGLRSRRISKSVSSMMDVLTSPKNGSKKLNKSQISYSSEEEEEEEEEESEGEDEEEIEEINLENEKEKNNKKNDEKNDESGEEDTEYEDEEGDETTGDEEDENNNSKNGEKNDEIYSYRVSSVLRPKNKEEIKKFKMHPRKFKKGLLLCFCSKQLRENTKGGNVLNIGYLCSKCSSRVYSVSKNVRVTSERFSQIFNNDPVAAARIYSPPEKLQEMIDGGYLIEFK